VRPDVPKFYFPDGKPGDQEHIKNAEGAIEKCFLPSKLELTKEEFDNVTTEVCGLPKFFRSVLFDKIDTAKRNLVSKQQFVAYWKKELERVELKKRMFKIIAKQGNGYITAEDFKPLFRQLLDTHPGLEFL
jgi:serine/threonine-protein phosphatase 2A regulatory subunit B''